MNNSFSIKEEKLNSILKSNFLKFLYQFKFIRKQFFFFYEVDKLIDKNGNINKEQIKSFKIYRFFKFIKSLDYFNQLKYKKYVNIKFFNFFGLQVLRVFFFLKKKKFLVFISNKKNTFAILNNFSKFNIVDYNLIKKEGVIVKRNFFNKMEINKILKVFKENTEKHIILNNKNHVTKKLEINFKKKDLGFVYNVEKEIRSLVCLLLNIKINNILPEVAVFQDSYKNYKKNISDHQDLFHTDVPYDTYKVYIYLNKVDENNGVFSYIPSSNKINFKRLLSEYLGSINIVNNQDDWKKNVAFKLYKNEQIKYCCGDAGTLVLANTAGYHARGPFFKKNKKRYILYFNYRYLN